MGCPAAPTTSNLLLFLSKSDSAFLFATPLFFFDTHRTRRLLSPPPLLGLVHSLHHHPPTQAPLHSQQDPGQPSQPLRVPGCMQPGSFTVHRRHSDSKRKTPFGMTLPTRRRLRIGILLVITTLLLTVVQQTAAVPTIVRPASGSRLQDDINNDRTLSTSRPLRKRETPAGMPLTCSNDFDCLQTTRPPNWPYDHATVQSANYACVFPQGSRPGGPNGGNNVTGTCQFVVTAGMTFLMMTIASAVFRHCN